MASHARTVLRHTRPRPYQSLRDPAQPLHDEREAQVAKYLPKVKTKKSYPRFMPQYGQEAKNLGDK